MAYLAAADLKTHIYVEIRDAIVNNDASITQDAIDTAMSEARGYLNRFDLTDEFTAPPAGRTNHKLFSVVKDIAAWHIARLANINMDLEHLRDLYKFATDWLKMVQAGKIDPQLPLAADTNDNAQGSSGIVWDSNPKRGNHF